MYTYTCTLAIFILISHRDCVCDNVDISELTWEQKEQVCMYYCGLGFHSN